jgi:phosphoesterase RecJ-like protein
LQICYLKSEEKLEGYKKFKNDLESSSKIILTCHVNPDGDAIGSELALYYTLKKKGKEVQIINHSETPYTLAFLDTEKVIQKYDAKIHDEIISNSDLIVFLDMNVLNRVVSMVDICKKFKGKTWVVDHHTDAENFADGYILNTEACATGEIIYDFFQQEKFAEIDSPIAIALYTAIMTDTGSFRFDRTTPRIHRIIADLMEFGIRPEIIYEQIYDQGEIGRLKLLGYALETLSLNSTKEICYMIINRKALEKTGCDEADIEGFVNYTTSVRGVKMGMLFYELPEGFKVSFRSKGKIPVNKLAAEFGGGGHLNASGARIPKGKIEEYLNKIITSAEKYLTNGE